MSGFDAPVLWKRVSVCRAGSLEEAINPMSGYGVASLLGNYEWQWKAHRIRQNQVDIQGLVS